MKTASLVMLITLLVVSSVRAEPLRVIKTVPEGATMEYRINGSLISAVALAPGVYEITVREIAGANVHGRPKIKRIK